MRGATDAQTFDGKGPAISIHAPRAGRDTQRMAEAMQELISIHAPRAGRDHCKGSRRKRQSISIHAPRAGRDPCRPGLRASGPYFNPRAPCGARLGRRPLAGIQQRFQSTRPVRGATYPRHVDKQRARFQSTRPVRGATGWMRFILWECLIFQSTRPVRGATYIMPQITSPAGISIHAPRAGRD